MFGHPLVDQCQVDPETGVTEMAGYWVVDDVGTIINPMLIAGQVHGGVAQCAVAVRRVGAAEALMAYVVPRKLGAQDSAGVATAASCGAERALLGDVCTQLLTHGLPFAARAAWFGSGAHTPGSGLESGMDGAMLHDLLPIPFTGATAKRVALPVLAVNGARRHRQLRRRS